MDLTMEKLQEGIAFAFATALKPFGEVMEAAIKEAAKPGVRKSLVDEHGDEEVSTALKGAKFFKTIYDYKFSGKTLTDDIITATIDDAHAAYTVPTEVAKDIDKVEAQESIVRKECRYIPQASSTMNRTVKTAGLTMTHPTEAATGSSTIPTYAQRPFTKVKGVMNVPVSNDLFKVSAVAMYDEIIGELGVGSAEDIDKYVFNDNTSPHTGILYAAGNSVYLGTGGSGTTLATVADDALYDYLIDMTTSLAGTSLQNAKFVFHQTVLGRIRQIKTSTGFPIPVYENRLPGDAPHISGRVLGYPAIASEQMPTYTDASSTGVAFGFFGNLKKYIVGQNDDLAIDMSREGTIGTGADVMSAWDLDLTFIRGIVFRSANLAVPNAFCKIETATS